MAARGAVMSIIVEDAEASERINALLHEYGEYIIGRMGIPYRVKKINIISIALDAPQNVIAAVSGKIGKLHDVFYSTVGNGTSVAASRAYAAEYAKKLKDANVDAVIMTST